MKWKRSPGVFSLCLMISNRSLIIRKNADLICYGWMLAILFFAMVRAFSAGFDFWALSGLHKLDDSVLLSSKFVLFSSTAGVLLHSIKSCDRRACFIQVAFVLGSCNGI